MVVVTTHVAAAPTFGDFTYSGPKTTGTGVNAYFCCPDGFELNTLTPSPSPTILIDYLSCTFMTSSYLENVFNLHETTSWPSELPTPLPVYNTEINDDDSGQPSCTTFTVTASGIAVAWSATDTAVVGFLLNGTVESEEDVWAGIPGFPPQYPTPRPVSPGCVRGSPAWLLAAILPAAIIGGGILMCCGCCCWAIHKKRRQRATGALSTFGRPRARRKERSEDQIPLQNMGRAHIAEHTAGVHARSPYEPVWSPNEERPPAYDDTLMMDDANLDASNTMIHDVMRARHAEDDYRDEVYTQ